jgi:hypothetical protein
MVENRSLVAGPWEVERVDAAFESRVLRRLGVWDLKGARTLLGEAADDDLFVAVARVDLRHRLTVARLDEIHDTRARVRACTSPGDPRRPWIEAILAESLLLACDPAASTVVDDALAETDDEPVPDLLSLYARARLRRARAGVAIVFDPTSDPMHWRALRDRAIDDLLRCGFVEEAELTHSLVVTAASLFRQEGLAESFDQVLESRRLLAGPPGVIDLLPANEGPAVSDVTDGAAVLLAFEMGDLRRMRESVEQARADGRSAHLLGVLLRFVEGVLAAVDLTAGADAGKWDACELALDDLGRTHPRIRQLLLLSLAHLLADLGSADAARYGARYLVLPAIATPRNLESEVLRVRLHVLAGRDVRRAAIVALFDEFALGGDHRAARAALRVARDLDRAGAADDAAALRRWSLGHLPHPGQLSDWERSQLTPGEPTREVTARSGGAGDTWRGVEIRVLRPTIEVVLDGEPLAVRTSHARLLIGLALAHPIPLHAEQASELLWPGDALAATRRRLNTEVHRLRQRLGRDAINRRGDLLSLSTSACHVDLFDYRAVLDDASAALEVRLAALASVTGVLCEAQLPYDETLIDERHQFVAHWSRLAGEVIAGHATAATRLRPVAAALAVDLDRP